MDYFLIYIDEDGDRMAAIPDVEGVYKRKIHFPEYKGDLGEREVIILEVANFFDILNDDDVEEFEGVVTSKFLASERISICIDKMGFEKFFTTIIKQHIETSDID